MRNIAHLSDFQTGTEDQHVIRGLIDDLNVQRPDLIVVTGDLTQRARVKQFIAARQYLDRMPKPQIILPGNHDIPLFDLFRRFFFPLSRYRKLITDSLSPVYVDGEILVYGCNTARSNTWKSGRLSRQQLGDLESRLLATPSSIFKVVATHHPLVPPPGEPGVHPAGRAESAIRLMERCGVDLLLAGHLHRSYFGDVMAYIPDLPRSILALQAGTATSCRRRGQPNSYNLITILPDELMITVRGWKDGRFDTMETFLYQRQGNKWNRKPSNQG